MAADEENLKMCIVCVLEYFGHVSYLGLSNPGGRERLNTDLRYN